VWLIGKWRSGARHVDGAVSPAGRGGWRGFMKGCERFRKGEERFPAPGANSGGGGEGGMAISFHVNERGQKSLCKKKQKFAPKPREG